MEAEEGAEGASEERRLIRSRRARVGVGGGMEGEPAGEEKESMDLEG